eukprot:Clim_evm42s218 gene=Clim_evmTU42s218
MHALYSDISRHSLAIALRQGASTIDELKNESNRRWEVAVRTGASDLNVLEDPRIVVHHNRDDVNDFIGGLRPGSLTEVTGLPGCGKHAFIAGYIQSAYQSGYAVIIFDCDGSGHEANLSSVHSGNWQNSLKSVRLISVSEQTATVEALEEVINRAQHEMSKSISLIIFTNYDFHLRGGFYEDSSVRHRVTVEMGQQLRTVAMKLSLSILITSNMTTQTHVKADQSHYVAALGNVWGHYVDSRYQLDRQDVDEYRLTRIKSSTKPSFEQITFSM